MNKQNKYARFFDCKTLEDCHKIGIYHLMDFLEIFGCGCCTLMMPSCATVPITERKQLKLIPEAKLNAQAAAIYEKVKEKEKLSTDLETLGEIKEIGKKIEFSVNFNEFVKKRIGFF